MPLADLGAQGGLNGEFTCPRAAADASIRRAERAGYESLGYCCPRERRGLATRLCLEGPTNDASSSPCMTGLRAPPTTAIAVAQLLKGGLVPGYRAVACRGRQPSPEPARPRAADSVMRRTRLVDVPKDEKQTQR